ncbi:hypothetical protein L2E82_45638 [Cichorium intybus]|uniref:Uncharacterized protein n=1 Tax=Cichorium intybus TaxID=13427 RepID=A0ACB8ZT47_CICIN|nr:hypothetical protein L2E82_45638 [Cichorium intybus]
MSISLTTTGLPFSHQRPTPTHLICLTTTTTVTTLPPTTCYRSCFLQIIETTNQLIVIVGETGFGKTTQISQYLHEAEYITKGYDDEDDIYEYGSLGAVCIPYDV